MVHKFLTQYTTGVEMQSENKKINIFFLFTCFGDCAI